MLRSLAVEFDAHDLKPKSKTVQLSDYRIVSVPVVDFEAVVRSLLDDHEMNNQQNLMKGIDPETWRSKVSAKEHEITDHHAIIGDKDSLGTYTEWPWTFMFLQQTCAMQVKLGLFPSFFTLTKLTMTCMVTLQLLPLGLHWGCGI
jgi:hypothetical protein